MGRSEDEKDSFWNLLLSVVGSIPASEMVIVGGDLNGQWPVWMGMMKFTEVMVLV